MSWQSMQPNSSCLQAQLNALMPEFFPMHQHKFAPQPDLPGLKLLSGENLMRIHLRPKREEPLDYSALLSRAPCFRHLVSTACHVSDVNSHTASMRHHLL